MDFRRFSINFFRKSPQKPGTSTEVRLGYVLLLDTWLPSPRRAAVRIPTGGKSGRGPLGPAIALVDRPPGLGSYGT